MAAQESIDMTLMHTNATEDVNSHDVMADFNLSGIFKADAAYRDQEVVGDDNVYRLNYGFPTRGETSVREQLRGLNEHIREFSKRRLTYDMDTLSAFQGIVGLYKQTEPLHLLHGIPLWTSAVAGSAAGAQITFALSVSSWYHRASSEQVMFVSEPCRRKTHLPSWTWAGWDDTVTWRAPANLEHGAYMSDLVKVERLNLLWAAEVLLCDPDRAGPVWLRYPRSANRLRRETPTLMEVKDAFVLNSFHREEETDKTWSWSQAVGRPGRLQRAFENWAWDEKWRRVGRRLVNYTGMSVAMTEEEWTDKHISGELVSVLIFAGKYLDNEHGSARFLTVRRVRDSTPERWERVGALGLTIPFLTGCLTTQGMFTKIPACRWNGSIAIQ